MRLNVAGATAIGLGLAVAGCSGPYALSLYGTGPNGAYPYQLPRVDPEEVAERAVVGAAAGTILGTGIGAMFALNPGIGTVVGAATGAEVGAAVGMATTPPLPDYKPIAVPTAAVIPEFYDNWPPGYRPVPVGSRTPPPVPNPDARRDG